MHPTRAASKRREVSCRAVQNIREGGALSRDHGRPSSAHPSLVDHVLRENAGLDEDANRSLDACSAVRRTGRPRLSVAMRVKSMTVCQFEAERRDEDCPILAGKQEIEHSEACERS
jgi:hypothetical protein